MKMDIRRWEAVLFLSLLVTGCSELTGVLDANGEYTLELVNGVKVPSSGQRGHVSGVIRLLPGNVAERVVTYQIDSSGTLREFIAIGSYRIRGESLELALREDQGRSQRVWQPRASIRGGVVTLRYPDPGDGPDVVEMYRR
jgi:hypothetical protein